MKIRYALQSARDMIASLGSDEASLEAELLVMHALGIDRVRLYQGMEDGLSDEQAASLFELLVRRLAHEPVAYIVGRKEFFGLEFEVTPAALIPRPETETLVERVIEFAKRREWTTNGRRRRRRRGHHRNLFGKIAGQCSRDRDRRIGGCDRAGAEERRTARRSGPDRVSAWATCCSR